MDKIMITLRSLAMKAEALNSGDLGETAYARFEQAMDCPLLAIVDAEQRPVGLLERNTFLLKLAGQYGRAVFAHRPVSMIMEPARLVVEASESAADFAEVALKHHLDDLMRGFIIVENGRYLGIGGVVDLLRATVEERTETLARQEKLAQSLRSSNQALERERAFVQAVVEHIPLLVAVRRQSDGQLRLLNKRGGEMLGVEPGGLVGRKATDLPNHRLARQIRGADALLDKQPAGTSRDFRYQSRNLPAPRTLRTTRIPVVLPEDEAFTLTIAEDVTEMRMANSRIEKLAHFDTLTGLPNRVQLHNRLVEMLEEAADAAEPVEVALIAIDLDRFKIVNDTFGHSAGDMVLKEMARRLRAALRANDLPARLGGDEFAVVISAPAAARLSEKIAGRLIDSMKLPFRFGDKVLHLGGSIGIAVSPRDCTTAADLMNYADMALYRAKAEGKGTWRRFSPDMREGLLQRNALETDLRQAMERNELEVHLQPQLEIATGRISGFECLMRWRHPVHGYVPPATFIPLAEDIGLIHRFGEWIINEACRIGSTLPAPLTIAVNISALQFRVDGLVNCVHRALHDHDLSPWRLELEITESVLIDDEDQVMKCIAKLRELGVKIALDDFGTGFASFSYLQRLAFDKIKIDRSFVHGLPEDQSSLAIVSAVTVMSRQLGAIVTAEGVETQTQFEALSELGCQQAQGYLIGRPAMDPSAYLLHPPCEAKVA